MPDNAQQQDATATKADHQPPSTQNTADATAGATLTVPTLPSPPPRRDEAETSGKKSRKKKKEKHRDDSKTARSRDTSKQPPNRDASKQPTNRDSSKCRPPGPDHNTFTSGKGPSGPETPPEKLSTPSAPEDLSKSPSSFGLDGHPIPEIKDTLLPHCQHGSRPLNPKDADNWSDSRHPSERSSERRRSCGSPVPAFLALGPNANQRKPKGPSGPTRDRKPSDVHPSHKRSAATHPSQPRHSPPPRGVKQSFWTSQRTPQPCRSGNRPSVPTNANQPRDTTSSPNSSTMSRSSRNGPTIGLHAGAEGAGTFPAVDTVPQPKKPSGLRPSKAQGCLRAKTPRPSKVHSRPTNMEPSGSHSTTGRDTNKGTRTPPRAQEPGQRSPLKNVPTVSAMLEQSATPTQTGPPHCSRPQRRRTAPSGATSSPHASANAAIAAPALAHTGGSSELSTFAVGSFPVALGYFSSTFRHHARVPCSPPVRSYSAATPVNQSSQRRNTVCASERIQFRKLLLTVKPAESTDADLQRFQQDIAHICGFFYPAEADIMSDTWNADVLMAKLPLEVRCLLIQRMKAYNDNAPWSLGHLLEQLEQTLSALRKAYAYERRHPTQPSGSRFKQQLATAGTVVSSSELARGSATEAQQQVTPSHPRTRSCPFCGARGKHWATDCPNYANVSSRYTRAIELDICIHCLCKDHQKPDSKACKVLHTGFCDVCGDVHHHKALCTTFIMRRRAGTTPAPNVGMRRLANLGLIDAAAAKQHLSSPRTTDFVQRNKDSSPQDADTSSESRVLGGLPKVSAGNGRIRRPDSQHNRLANDGDHLVPQSAAPQSNTEPYGSSVGQSQLTIFRDSCVFVPDFDCCKTQSVQQAGTPLQLEVSTEVHPAARHQYSGLGLLIREPSGSHAAVKEHDAFSRTTTDVVSKELSRSLKKLGAHSAKDADHHAADLFDHLKQNKDLASSDANKLSSLRLVADEPASGTVSQNGQPTPTALTHDAEALTSVHVFVATTSADGTLQQPVPNGTPQSPMQHVGTDQMVPSSAAQEQACVADHQVSPSDVGRPYNVGFIVDGRSRTGWEPLKDCDSHQHKGCSHLRIQEAVVSYRTICKEKGKPAFPRARHTGRRTIDSFGKMFVVVWAARHHLKSNHMIANPVVIDFLEKMTSSRSSELPLLVDRYFDEIRDQCTDRPFKSYDFQSAIMRWIDGCPTAAAFFDHHASGPILFQADFLNRCRQDIREAYQETARLHLADAIDWSRMRSYQVRVLKQPPWTNVRDAWHLPKDRIVKVTVPTANILNNDLIVFTEPSLVSAVTRALPSASIIQTPLSSDSTLDMVKQYFMGHLVQRIYWFCPCSGVSPSVHLCRWADATDHFLRHFPGVRLSCHLPDAPRVDKPEPTRLEPIGPYGPATSSAPTSSSSDRDAVSWDTCAAVLDDIISRHAMRTQSPNPRKHYLMHSPTISERHNLMLPAPPTDVSAAKARKIRTAESSASSSYQDYRQVEQHLSRPSTTDTVSDLSDAPLPLQLPSIGPSGAACANPVLPSATTLKKLLALINADTSGEYSQRVFARLKEANLLGPSGSQQQPPPCQSSSLLERQQLASSESTTDQTEPTTALPADESSTSKQTHDSEVSSDTIDQAAHSTATNDSPAESSAEDEDGSFIETVEDPQRSDIYDGPSHGRDWF